MNIRERIFQVLSDNEMALGRLKTHAHANSARLDTDFADLSKFFYSTLEFAKTYLKEQIVSCHAGINVK